MATYEVLEPGGHARLVSDTKGYANRASGVGTTQIADESVTSAKLADDVTDTLDNIESFTDPMNKNGLHGELAEGAVLTADDVYAAPAREVDVYGVSTQVTTTGKNLFDPTTVTLGKYFDVNGYLANTSNWDVSDYIEVSGTSICVSGNNTANNVYHAFYDESKTFLSTVRIDTAQPFTIPNNAKYIRVTIHKTRTNTAQVELGTTATSYEPYSGGVASPRPDWTQPIKNVDDLTLVFAGKNLFDPSYLLEASDWTVSDGVYTGMSNALYNKYKLDSGGYPIGGLSGTAQSYVMSLDYTPSDATKNTYIQFKYDDGTIDTYAITMKAAGHYTGASNPNKVLAAIGFLYSSAQSISLSNIQLELGTTATTYAPYVGQSVEIPLSNHIARSLPDGTRDELTLSYIGPSTEHEGWGVFSKTLVQRVWEVDLGTLTWSYTGGATYPRFVANLTNQVYPAPNVVANAVCTAYVAISQNDGYSGAESRGFCINSSGIWLWDQSYTDAATFKTAMNGTKLIYQIATPITHDLGTVELPILPNPLTAWADGGSAQPTMQLEYERDVNIVISNMMSVIADAATS